MTSLGRIQGALASTTQENTLALANANFDFTLVRIEAPAEYRDLGAALSSKRRKAAEDGSTHRTARQLGALFEETLPSTPSLLKAYGLRASEIAQSLLTNPRDGNRYGAFAEHVGIDGTSIWAAATSGKGAVAIHLLACMLARIWSASEAVSIWEEILEERKKELSTWDESGAIPSRRLQTGRISLSYEQLADWDASARAWLRAADKAKGLNQKQFLIIVENLNISVSRDMKVYESVMLAWRTAMSTIDKLIGGVCQSVHHGAVLLGLAAWHLYPDLIVLGSITTSVRQNDPLIAPGGTVTLGLRGKEFDDSRGVYWSLSLAHVRYYGDPVISKRAIDSSLSRISIEDLWQIILASLITAWGKNVSNTTKAVELVSLMWQTCEEGLAAPDRFKWRKRMLKESWLRYLGDAAGRYSRSREYEASSCRRLFGLGQRKCALLGLAIKNLPIFGLSDTSLLQIVKFNERIGYLRSIAANYSKDGDLLVVKTCLTIDGKTRRLHLATANAQQPSKASSSLNNESACAKSWLYKSDSSHRPQKISVLLEVIDGEQYFSLNPDSIVPLKDGKWFEWTNPPPNYSEGVTKPSVLASSEERKSRWSFLSGTRLKARPIETPVALFEYVFGDVRTAALFRRRDLHGVGFRRMDRKELEHSPEITMEQITQLFTSKLVDPEFCLSYMLKGVGSDSCRYFDVLAANNALRAIATVSKVYAPMTGATVSLNIVIFGPLTKAKWAVACKTLTEEGSLKKGRGSHEQGNQDTEHVSASGFLYSNEREDSLLPYDLSRPTTFSCIAMFESGGFDLSPTDLDTVMAISSSDSIFVAAAILCDPAKRPLHHEVCRIFGNIGRAGIAFLIPPAFPRTKNPGLESYQVINHEPYDGRLENCFQNTTLHLGFSGYEFVLDVGEHGGRGREAFFIETLTKVHDRGEWIADLDILLALGDPQLCIDGAGCVGQSNRARCCHLAGSLESQPLSDVDLVSIDRWEELLERPLKAAVVRAHGNWLARLAATAVSVKLGNHTVISSLDGNMECTKCLGISPDVTNTIYIV